MVLNDVVGPGEVSGLQGCQQPLMVVGGYLLLGAGVAGKKVVGHDELALNAVIDLTETAVPGLFHQYPVEIQIGAPGLDDVGRLVGGYTLPRQTLQRLEVHGQELVLDIRQRLMLQQQPHLDDIADLLDEQKHTYGITYINAIHNFMTMYGIDSITEDAFKKNYYRWRAEIRRKEKKRGYNRSKK